MSALTILADKPLRRVHFNKVLLIGWTFVVWGCGAPFENSDDTAYRLHRGETQGTTYMIKYHGGDSIGQHAIDAVLEDVDAEFNLWLPESRINAINAFDNEESMYSFVDSNRLWSLLWDQCLDLHEASGGAFDPTVHPLVELWGFGLNKSDAVTDEAVSSILPHVGMTTDRIDLDELENDRIYQKTFIRKGDAQTSLDFNGIAQGLTVDLLGDVLEANGVNDYMVEVGGEVKCKGVRRDGEPWRIAIDRPQDAVFGERPLQVIINVRDAAICTSGNYRKFHEVNGVRRSHTISPFTGYPVEHGLLSVTIKAVDAAAADALATACMVLGPALGKAFISDYRVQNPYEGIEAYFISAGTEGANYIFWETDGWKRALEPESQL